MKDLGEDLGENLDVDLERDLRDYHFIVIRRRYSNTFKNELRRKLCNKYDLTSVKFGEIYYQFIKDIGEDLK